MVFITISNLKYDKEVSFFCLLKKFLIIMITIFFRIALIDVAISWGLIYYIPEEFLMWLYSYYKLPDHNIFYINQQTPPINPQDPLGQLTDQDTGYNRNGTNQPLATNMANELENNYRARGSTLSGSLLPVPVKSFLLDHLSVNDRESYDKLLDGVNLDNNEQPKWWNLGNTKRLRDGLRNLA